MASSMICAQIMICSSIPFVQMWMTYAPIPGVSMKFYGISSTEVDWFSISFFIVSLIVGFFSMFILDTFGLAPSVSEVMLRGNRRGIVHYQVICSVGR